MGDSKRLEGPGIPTIGAYYYPWYQQGEPKEGWAKWSHAMRLHLKDRQEPMVGLYDSADPDVIGAHIEQSLRGGIDFWSVSWWGPRSKTDRIFKDAVLAHPDSLKLKYAMLYESEGRFGKFSNPDYSKWIGDLDYLRKTYFNDERYLKCRKFKDGSRGEIAASLGKGEEKIFTRVKPLATEQALAEAFFF